MCLSSDALSVSQAVTEEEQSPGSRVEQERGDHTFSNANHTNLAVKDEAGRATKGQAN